MEKTVLIAAQASDASTGAIFTLLGVAITGAVTILTIFLKHFLDARAQAAEHTRNVERLRLELAEKRSDGLRVQQTQALARFLAATLSIFSQIRRARVEWERTQSNDHYFESLASIDSSEAQIAFEEVRLAAPEKVLERATRLWNHLRRGRVPQGQSTDRRDWAAWRSKYWGIRRDLVADFQLEVHGDVCSPNPQPQNSVTARHEV